MPELKWMKDIIRYYDFSIVLLRERLVIFYIIIQAGQLLLEIEQERYSYLPHLGMGSSITAQTEKVPPFPHVICNHYLCF